MIFSDQHITDEVIDTLEFLMNNHIMENYQVVRDIILGYDSKKEEWISKYGNIYAEKGTLIENGISNSFAYTKRKNIDNQKEIFRNRNNEMIFYEHPIFDNVVIRIDEATKRILEMLFTLSKNVIEYRYIIDIILLEWIGANIKNAIVLNILDIRNITPDKGLHYFQTEMKQSSWNEFKKLSRTRGLKIRDAFKLAVLRYLEDRSLLLNNQDIIN